MSDVPSYRNANSDTDDYPGTPRWVKVFGIVVLVLVVVVIMATGVGGAHGPRRHMPSGGAAGVQQP